MDGDRAARLEALLDRQDIHDCLSRMSRGIDRFDKPLFLSAFHDDAVVAAGPYVGGAAGLYDWSSGLQAGHNATFHMPLTHNCDLDGDIAHAETYYIYVATGLDGMNMFAGGRYIDRFERREGVWKLAVRNNAIEWSSLVPAMENPLNAVADLLANGESLRNSLDISYRRPLINRRIMNVP